MTDILQPTAEILPPVHFSDKDSAEADLAREEVDVLLDVIKSHEFDLASNYAQLGALLFRVRDRKFWLSWGFNTFGAYVAHLEARVLKGRSQIYAYIGIAEVLLPMLSEEQLITFGISKAGELKRFVKSSGRRIPEALLLKAGDPKVTATDLRTACYEELHQAPDPKGAWMDLGGFYALPDEKKEILDALEVATRIDPVIPHTLPDHEQRKEKFLRLAREFNGTYAELVYRGIA